MSSQSDRSKACKAQLPRVQELHQYTAKAEQAVSRDLAGQARRSFQKHLSGLVASVAWLRALAACSRVLSLACEPDLKGASSVISSCRSRWTAAVAVARHCQRLGLRADTILHSTVVTACERGTRWEQGLRIMEEACTNKLRVDTVACSSVISSVARTRRWLKAFFGLNNMRERTVRPNVVATNAAISSCDRAGQWKPAAAIFRAAVSLGTEPDTISCNSLLSSCTATAPWYRAVALCAEMSKACQSDLISYNVLMTIHEKGGLWQRGLHLLSELSACGGRHDIITVSAVAGACARTTQWEHPLLLLRQAASDGMRANIVLFSMAVDACAGVWQAATALTLEASLVLRLDAIMLNSAMMAHSSWQQSSAILANSRRNSVEADVAMTSTAIGAGVRDSIWPWALLMLHRLHLGSQETDVTLQNTVIGACENACSWAHVLRLSQIAGLRPDTLTVSSLLRACEYAGRSLQVQLLLAGLSPGGLETCRLIERATVKRRDGFGFTGRMCSERLRAIRFWSKLTASKLEVM